MKRITPLLLASLLTVFVFAGCSSSEESTNTKDPARQGEFQRIDADEEIAPIIETPAEKEELPGTEKGAPASDNTAPQADTQQQPAEVAQEAPPARGAMMWSVQIGAFKVESGAIALINEAKTKFNQPVYKDFDPVTNFYKVTVGSFQQRDKAAQFKLEVQSKGYPDAFTVEVRR